MSRAVAPVADLASLHDALACAATATTQAWRGDRAAASLSLIEAHSAAEEAFGGGSAEVDALDVVFAAITQAGRSKTRTARRGEATPQRASDLSR